MVSLPTRKEQSSWRSWGGVQNEVDVAEEISRITRELKELERGAGFPLEILPVHRIGRPDDVADQKNAPYDVTLLYACTGSGDTVRACLALKPDTIVFVRHRSGPVYYWYEALSGKYFGTDQPASPNEGTEVRPRFDADDVVVDDPDELQWRLRGLAAAKNLRGTRIVALGGAWGKYAPDAPQKAQERFGLQIIDAGYPEFEKRIKRAYADTAFMAVTEKWADRFLSLPGTVLATDRRFVVNAFALYRLFKDLMVEHDATAFTVKSCMGTIIPMSETTACLSLGLINDEGLLAFCESDFVIIPAGILLRYVCGKPVFLHNSTFPHQGLVTCAHCACPRRLDGNKYEPTRIVTHYESDYGAAPKVDIPIGQKVTFIDPEYSTTRWLGFTGVVSANPDYAICRSQQDVQIDGDWRRLRKEARDSHWMMAYGNHLNAVGYAARKLGIEWVTV